MPRTIVDVSNKKGRKWIQMYELWEIGKHNSHTPVFRAQYPFSSKQKDTLSSATKYNPELTAAKLMSILKDEGCLRGCENKHMAKWVKHFRKRNRSQLEDLRFSEMRALEKERIIESSNSSNDCFAPKLLSLHRE